MNHDFWGGVNFVISISVAAWLKTWINYVWCIRGEIQMCKCDWK